MARRTKEQARATRQQIIVAARMVFHQYGVGRSSMDNVAQAAGLTRGAIYWHFKDKAELFHAVRVDTLFPVFEEIDSLISSNRYADPLDGIGAALGRLFQILDDCPGVRMVFETMINRCERVAEFASVQSALDWPITELLVRLEHAYSTAAALGTLGVGLDPNLVAKETVAFAYGLMCRMLGGDGNRAFGDQVRELISLHLALRRFGPAHYANAPGIDSSGQAWKPTTDCEYVQPIMNRQVQF